MDKKSYQYAWSLTGQKVHTKIQGKREARSSLIGALWQKKLVAPFQFSGTCNTDLFLIWLVDILLPNIKKGCTIIMDNASFHMSNKIRDAIEAAGCHLKYLPPYSPDLNPIEQMWAVLKIAVRKTLRWESDLTIAIADCFKKLI